MTGELARRRASHRAVKSRIRGEVRPRATCPDCGQRFAVTIGEKRGRRAPGELWSHRTTADTVCAGSGRRVA